jgi:16S rRNA (guanine966-N2)-methyltransferase
MPRFYDHAVGRQNYKHGYTLGMRVIAGRYRRRTLLAPLGLETRPILDRVKTALFDWLGSRLAMPGELPPLRVLDLFSGSGSLGIEALSRGALSCAFVENEPKALDCLLKNLDQLGIGPAARINKGLAETVRIAPPGGKGFDLIFLDPPYRLSEETAPGSVMHRIVSRLGTDIVVSEKASLLWRHDANCILPDTMANRWCIVERREWGGMAITMYELATEAGT